MNAEAPRRDWLIIATHDSGSMTLGRLSDVFVMGPRLAALLSIEAYAGVSVREFAGRRSFYVDSMLRERNAGKTTIARLDEVVARLMEGDPGGRLPQKGPVPDAPVVMSPLPPVDPVEAVTRALEAISPRHREAIERRNGINRPIESLKDIGKSWGVTRERARQIEAAGVKAMGRLLQGHFGLRRWFLWDVSRRAVEWWSKETWIDQADMRRLYLAVPWEVRVGGLALGYDFDGTMAALDAAHWRMGYLAPGSTAEKMGAVLAGIREVLSEVSVMPEALASARSGISSPDLARLASVPAVPKVIAGYAMWNGFVRESRAAGIHAVTLAFGGIADRALGTRVPLSDGMASTGRNADLALVSNPGLFVRVMADFCYALGHGASRLPEIGCVPHAEDGPSRDPEGWDGAISEIGHRLRQVGPATSSTLMNEFGPAAVRAALPRLQAEIVARRVTPGVLDAYGSSHRGDWSSEPVPEGLFSQRVADAYVAHRRGGDGGRCYYWWTPSYEWRLCEWAEANLAPEALGRLLSVVDPESWGVPAAVESRWLGMRAGRPKWDLPRLSPASGPLSAVTPRELLALLVLLEQLGAVGPAYAARICNMRAEVSIGLGAMAVAVACGAAVPRGADWSLGLVATEGAHVLRAGLEDVLFGTLSDSWGAAESAVLADASARFSGVEGLPSRRGRQVVRSLLQGELPARGGFTS